MHLRFCQSVLFPKWVGFVFCVVVALQVSSLSMFHPLYPLCSVYIFVTFLDLFSYCLVFYTSGWNEYSILPLSCSVISIFNCTNSLHKIVQFFVLEQCLVWRSAWIFTNAKMCVANKKDLRPTLAYLTFHVEWMWNSYMYTCVCIYIYTWYNSIGFESRL